MFRKYAKSRRAILRSGLATLGLAVLWPAASLPAFAQSDENYKVVEDVAAYLGVVPAEIVRGHPINHPEPGMHGGPPAGSHPYHIVVALFDEPSGQRIEDAEVTAHVSGLGHVGGTRIALEPMLIADVVTYGGFVTLPGTDRYTIDLVVSRPGQVATTKISFSYEHVAE